MSTSPWQGDKTARLKVKNWLIYTNIKITPCHPRSQAVPLIWWPTIVRTSNFLISTRSWNFQLWIFDGEAFSIKAQTKVSMWAMLGSMKNSTTKFEVYFVAQKELHGFAQLLPLSIVWNDTDPIRLPWVVHEFLHILNFYVCSCNWKIDTSKTIENSQLLFHFSSQLKADHAKGEGIDCESVNLYLSMEKSINYTTSPARL